mmetsp:Transcript_30775/g.45588  ORF Transcript_30775/g.45588 Transcript_30775/m.45588 type:complete len:254 (+) Transcript_30775:302-1063(+)
MDEGVVELVVDETVLEFLNEVQHSMVEFLWRTRIIVEGPLSCNVAIQNLLGKNILLVEEKHNGSIGKGSIVANRPKEFERFHHTIRSLRFCQCLVVFRERGNENDGIDVIKTVNPFAPFRALPANVVHLKINSVDPIAFHNHLCGSNTSKEDILCGWSEARGRDALNILKVFLVSIDDVDRRAFRPDFLHRFRLPKDADRFNELQELFRIVVCSEPRARTMTHPIIRVYRAGLSILCERTLRHRRLLVDDICY